jgi:hypothetical protein
LSKNENTYSLRLQRKKVEIANIFTADAKALSSVLNSILVLKFFENLLGFNIKRSLNYYSRLLQCFAKDHPVQAGFLITAIADILLGNEDDIPSVLSPLIAGGVGISILNYRKILQDKDISKIITTSWRPRYSEFELYKPGKIFTRDGRLFYEVTSRFGDPPGKIKKFKILENGSWKYEREEIDIGDSYSSASQKMRELLAFVEREKLFDVTDCMLKLH